MVRKIAGEKALIVGKQKIVLRLPIGAIMDIEAHFDKSILMIAQSMAVSMPRVGDLSVLLCSLTGKALDDEKEQERAFNVIKKVGVDVATIAIAECIMASLVIDNKAAAGQEGQSTTEGKRKATALKKTG